MIYRAGWKIKLGQERVFTIDITRECFELAVNQRVLSHFDSKVHQNKEQCAIAAKHTDVVVQ